MLQTDILNVFFFIEGRVLVTKCVYLYLSLSEVQVISHNSSDCVTVSQSKSHIVNRCLISIYETLLVHARRHRDLSDLWPGSHRSGADHIGRQFREDAVSPVFRPVLRGLRDHLVVVGLLGDTVAGCVEDEEEQDEELEDETVPGESHIIIDDP